MLTVNSTGDDLTDAGPVSERREHSFDFDEPDHFTAGAVGEPGQRVFYLQAAPGRRSVATLRLEKQQVGGAGRVPRPASWPTCPTPRPPPGDVELDRAGRSPSGSSASLAVAYEEADDRILLVAEELVVSPTTTTTPTSPPIRRADRAAPPPASASPASRSPPSSARATELVAVGPAACPLCGRPIDPDGHACPTLN